MYKVVLTKSIKYSVGRLLMTALAIALGVIMTFGFVSGVNCISQDSPKWEDAYNWQESGVSSDIKNKITPVFMDMQIRSCVQDENGSNDSDPICNLAPGLDFYHEVHILKFAQTEQKIGSLDIPEAGQYYLSSGIDKKIRQSGNVEAISGQGKFLGIIPSDMTTGPDEKLVISGQWQDNSCMKYIPKYMDGNDYNYQSITASLEKMSKDAKAKDGSNTSEFEYCAESVKPIWSFNDYTVKKSTLSAATLILDGFKVLGGLCIVFPILLFVAISAGLGAKQKESRLAALRLIGVTKKQISILITLESLIGVIFGIMLGLLAFIPVRQVIISSFTIGGMHFWPKAVNVSLFQSCLIIIGLILFSVSVNIRNMSKVNVSPLGIVREQKIKSTPKFRSVILLILCVLGLVSIFASSISKAHLLSEPTLFLMFMVIFVLCIAGILLAGPYLTYKLASLFAKTSNPIILLASRRIMNNPGITFKSVAGLVIAMLTGGFLLTISDISKQISGEEPIIDELIHLVEIGLALTVFITIASLVVSTLGGLFDRKNSLTTLNLSGVTISQLKSLVICESLVPMIATVIISSAVGAFCAMTAWSITQGVSVSASAATISTPGIMFWSTVFIVVILAVIATLSILPVLKKIISVEGSRKE